ncbi:Hypothetical predicted protein [Pelobates cultripes]|uniref:Uncharacterized protein n=1 Tax=Pelobates cultripes TaxID=61616 RepID=A0AAD1S0L5_PELCU|nr:Hypothetical predicted protein [Pelobates cultripes]
MADGKPAQPTQQHSNREAGFTLKFNDVCKWYWRGWEERRKPTARPALMELPTDNTPEAWHTCPVLGTLKAQARTRSPNTVKQGGSTRPRHPPPGDGERGTGTRKTGVCSQQGLWECCTTRQQGRRELHVAPTCIRSDHHGNRLRGLSLTGLNRHPNHALTSQFFVGPP